MKTGRFRSFGFMLAVVIGGGVAGWILLPIFIAFGAGIGAAVGREPGIDRWQSLSDTIKFMLPRIRRQSLGQFLAL